MTAAGGNQPNLSEEHPFGEQQNGGPGLTDAILKTVLDGIVTIDETGTILSVNPAVERIFKYSQAETLGQNVAMLMPEPDRSQHDRYIKRHLETGEARIIGIGREVRGQRKDGSIFPLQLGVSAAHYQGRRIFVGIMRDLTEQRRAERQRDRLFETVPDLLCTIGLDGRFRTLNPAWERTFGYPAAQLQETAITTYLHPEDLPALESLLAKAAAHAPPGVVHTRFRSRDGSYRWLEWLAVPIPDEALLYAAARDITERKEIDRLKSEFVSTVSHELRTPLTSIRGSLGLLTSDTAALSDGQRHEMLRIARSNTDRLIRLINDILDLDKLEAGRMDLAKEPVLVAQIVDGAIASIAGMAEQHGVTVHTRTPPHQRVIGDGDRLVQVLVNLLSNAIKFSPPGSTVALEASTEAPDRVRLSVRDQGPGIAPEHHARSFDRFEQIGSAYARSQKGTGLGLAIAKAIIDQHGGTIGVTSEVGVGSEFYVLLPTFESDDARGREAPAGGYHNGGPVGQCVLVIGKNRELAQLICMRLENEGYDIRHAPSLTTAEALVAHHSIDVVLLDMDAAGDSELAALRWVEQVSQTRRLPTVALSSHDRNSRNASPLADWIVKPVAAQDLSNAIRRAIRGQNAVPSVLVVEDDASTRNVIAAQISTLGAHCILVASGEEALKIASSTEPDLIILDIYMRGLDGFAVVEDLRRRKTRTTPLVVYTSRDLTSTDRQRLKLGMTRYLTKARVSNEDLLAAVRDLLNGLLPLAAGSSTSHAPPCN